MFKTIPWCMLGLCMVVASTSHASPISLTALGSAYTQDFNTLAVTGISSVLPAGWELNESGTNADASYAAGTGSNNTGNTYSFGATDSSDRALGGLQSGALIPTIGATFNNNTGATINSLAIAYTGEQWRLGTAGRNDQIDFQYSTDATSLTTGTWIDVNALDFVAPISAASIGALDGNAAANRMAISGSIFALNIVNGATFWIRWTDFNAAGADDGLAVDDFSLVARRTTNSPIPEPGTLALLSLGLAGLAATPRRSKQKESFHISPKCSASQPARCCKV
jgi:hypothetical protein